MNAEHLLEPLKQLLTHAEALLVVAETEDWFELEGQLTSYIQKVVLVEDEAYLQSLKNAGLALEAQGLVLQIQGINQKIDDHAKSSHEKIASELRQMIQSTKALDAYGR